MPESNTSDRPPARGGASAALLEEAARWSPGGVHSCRRVSDPPLCVARAYGAYVEDVEGRRYIDFHGAYGSILIGHCHPAIVERVTSAIAQLDLVGMGTTEAETELARKIVHHLPSAEQVAFCNTGAEATYHALRLARGVTGRPDIVKFQGCYHGFHDSVLPNALTGVPGADPDRSAGVLAETRDRTIVCRYNDLEHVGAALEARAGQVAAIIVEPIGHNLPGILPKPGFLEGLRRLCDEHGTVLIFDEVISGFRHGLGGYQAIAGVTPDLTTLAKAMGNGFPIAAVAGRRELMQRFNTHPDGDVFFSGTYNAGMAQVTAALATIDLLEREPVHEHVFRLGERMRGGLQQIADRAGVEATVGGFGSVFQMCFAAGPLDNQEDVLARNDVDLFLRFRREGLARGILEAPNVNAMRSHVSFSHSDADVDLALEAAEDSLRVALGNRGS